MSPAVEIDTADWDLFYERDAEEYCRSLPLEHFMESTYQSKQREITLESLALVRAMWSDLQVFNELLVHYVLPGADKRRPTRVVPDNMVVVHSKPIKAKGSFVVWRQPVLPTLVLEYVSQGNQRKDYVDNFKKYELDLKIPYYLLFKPESEDLRVFHLMDDEYVPVERNTSGRLAIAELELEVAVLDGWVRFWFRNELLPLPGDLLQSLNAERAARMEEKKARLAAEKAALAAEKAALAAEKAALAAEKATAQERDARIAAETEIARLREELARSQRPAAN
jgi:Uma2 family endonuclease